MLQSFPNLHVFVSVPDDCLTVEGATEAEKQRRFYIQMLEFVNRSRSQPNSIPALMDTLDNLRKEVNVSCGSETRLWGLGCLAFVFQNGSSTFPASLSWDLGQMHG